MEFVLAAIQAKHICLASPTCRNITVLPLELPSIRDVASFADRSRVPVKQVVVFYSVLLFEQPELFFTELIQLWVWSLPDPASNTTVLAVKFFKNRRKVYLLNFLPSFCSICSWAILSR